MGFFLKTESAGSKTHTRRFSRTPENAYRGLRVENPGRRLCNPALGRWISRDPIGERGGLALYGFVRNEPVRGLDAIGLQSGWFYGIDPVTKMPTKEGHPPNPKKWYETLPDCPCTIALDSCGCPKEDPKLGTGWGSPTRKNVHKGATFQIRWTQGVGKPGQQCMFDSDGKLINTGSGAGTPDAGGFDEKWTGWDSVEGKLDHAIKDGWQYRLFGEEYDHETHPPNKGKDENGKPCADNDGSAAKPTTCTEHTK